MRLNSTNKSIKTLLVMCFFMCIALIILGIFSYLLKGWLVWEFDKPFPFGKEELITILKISLLGVPTGLVFWIFGVR
ncbi:hypothetical protein DBV23_12130 [Edwardsiella ictaluri]|nr:hypothetical protein DBV23_12130 [Edwardsiella ictaluri]STP83621.1 Uncharacterised protein [Edwardsiella ictaluri]BEH99976.1 hypothetical protein KH20906_27040 [Edwardsiella ictaluri]BEI03457.1 hypothetical protein KB20921_27180 [Edwardsiella ictaluri]BEI06918.1 hypothetical protein KH201010_27040 [Edwardsiella ictaluri]